MSRASQVISLKLLGPAMLGLCSGCNSENNSTDVAEIRELKLEQPPPIPTLTIQAMEGLGGSVIAPPTFLPMAVWVVSRVNQNGVKSQSFTQPYSSYYGSPGTRLLSSAMTRTPTANTIVPSSAVSTSTPRTTTTTSSSGGFGTIGRFFSGTS